MSDATPAPPKKRRKKTASPTARTLAYCRARGWTADVVERRLPHCFITRDLFGFLDLVVMDGRRGLLGIQATSDLRGGNSGARCEKIELEPRALLWLAAGLRVEVWAWRMINGRKAGARKTWAVRRLKAELVDGAICWDDVEDA